MGGRVFGVRPVEPLSGRGSSRVTWSQTLSSATRYIYLLSVTKMSSNTLAGIFYNNNYDFCWLILEKYLLHYLLCIKTSEIHYYIISCLFWEFCYQTMRFSKKYYQLWYFLLINIISLLDQTTNRPHKSKRVEWNQRNLSWMSTWLWINILNWSK